ncbi:lipid IV(A) 4-amino-4-deoxy-L-arabinosyltransferase [Extensimonas vulgaris]|uniref:Undecaprenyl phosphate-alpha-4-amino-4-deoxy-L-arabinose arabinosyl transferase n=1 Tax=Extensimonas vulgaris TaxID=1031594 RepID=A0A369AM47_9BURK|nr:lipid IV(A) 4-amino-4-deoxy-L-arabinosyltransferase [Extensimonas vulgaris]RCX10241.1 4-amino-4-deoxy-L-arabinose transferase [Extensimonas vulgaris]TWI39818.1 4-amino-4-deoxy-L-arabinose transferase [Extensimonas vulgaris]TXD17383.1 lipid IV(A) 4-amino-4-deoxy-L-arabinosyltransferase [Extensimonas vulgaris]
MTPRRAALALGAVFALFFLVPLGLHGLWIPDESRYAQIGQEMLRSGDWIAPHFLGLRYFEKPIGGYWLIALSEAVFGENLFGARFASALVTLLTTLLVYGFAQRLWRDARTAIAAALVFLSCALVAGQAGYSNLDPQFNLWVTLGMVALYFAFESGSRASRLRWWAVLGLACGLGFLTKGFLAFALPVLVALPYALWQGRWRVLLAWGPLAVGVALLVCLPWALAVHWREPDFWNFFFWNEHVRRFASATAQHMRPWWFFVPIVFAGALPWAALLPPALRLAWSQRGERATAFVLLWFAVPFVFFSLSKGKLPTYILPCFAPLALGVGRFVVQARSQRSARALRVNGALNLLIGAGAVAGLVWLQLHDPLYSAGEGSRLALVVAVLGVWLLCAALQCWQPLRHWAAPAFGVWTFFALVPAALPLALVHNKMPDQFILAHRDALRGAHTLVSDDVGTAAALAWRLARTDVVMLDTQGELAYGLSQPDVQGRYVTRADFPAWLAQARRNGPVGIVLRLGDAEEEPLLALLPPDTRVHRAGRLVIAIVP